MLYNFRFDREFPDEILRRLKNESLLSQGWGGAETNLDVRQTDFVEKCKERYQLATTRIPSNLLRMREFRDGDILVTPHLPEYGKVSIHIVDGDFPECYSYLQQDPMHLNHRIRIKTSFGLDGSISIQNAVLAPWRGKLQWLRLPILPIDQFASLFDAVIRSIQSGVRSHFGPSRLDEFLNKLRDHLLGQIRDELQKISPSGGTINFEGICEHIIKTFGYQITARRQYDGSGGDIDFRCTRDRADASPFESGQTILCVQVKKHEGTTDEYAVDQVLKMLKAEPSADGCVMSLADDFTKQATELAEKNGITLLNGKEICNLLLRILAT